MEDKIHAATVEEIVSFIHHGDLVGALAALDAAGDVLSAAEIAAFRSMAHLRVGDLEMAEKELGRGSTDDVRYLRASLDVALAKGDQSANRLFEQLAAIPDQRVNAANSVAHDLIRRRKYNEAIRFLNKERERVNDPDYLLPPLVNAMREAGHHEEALKMAKEELKRLPHFTWLKRSMLLCLVAARRNVEAKRIAEELLDEDPDDADNL